MLLKFDFILNLCSPLIFFFCILLKFSHVQIYEMGDVVLLDEKKDVGASNRRLLGALYCGANSGFEVNLLFL